MMNLKIEKGKVYVEGIETSDPTLIGLAVLDMAENEGNILQVA